MTLKVVVKKKVNKNTFFLLAGALVDLNTLEMLLSTSVKEIVIDGSIFFNYLPV